VTINSQYDVWYTHEKAKSAAQDGDIHFSGYDKKIGMPIVAEIMNAKDEKEAIKEIIAHQGRGEKNNPKLNVQGVWRIWPEHMAARTNYYQGMTFSLKKIQEVKTNPDHVFEIHPVTQIGNINLTRTLRNIEGYIPKRDVRYILDVYAKKHCVISQTQKNISIETKDADYNYIDMWVRLDSIWHVDDGAFAFCAVFDTDFNPASDDPKEKQVTKRTRVALVKDSEVYNQFTSMANGEYLRMLGTPRLDLAIISWRAWAAKKRPEVLKWRLPIEIIAVGIMH
jgi:hypothetical protein